jgi:adenylate kinase
VLPSERSNEFPSAAGSAEHLARRAVGFALDPDISIDDSARVLATEAHGDQHLLEAARFRILRAASGPASDRAARAVWIARQLVDADDDGWRAVDETRRVVLVGIPGAGKGTQGARLARTLAVPHISMGDLVRAVATEETPFAFQAQVFMDSGRLVPDSLVLDILARRFEADDVRRHGFVLDGFPRTLDQAVALDALLGARRVEVVVELVVEPCTARARLRARGRPDDGDEVVERRMAEFERETAPVVYWYHSRAEIWSVDGDRRDDHVTDDLSARVDAWMARRRGS